MADAPAASLTFHTGVPDVIDYVCRLCRKAVARDAKVLIRARDDHLRRLDEALWTFEREGFLPHARIARVDGAALSDTLTAAQSRAPVWLSGEDFADALLLDADRVVVNLGPGAAVEALEGEGGEGSSNEGGPSPLQGRRLIEVVGQDATSREEGQRRWRLYRRLGWSAEHLPYGAGRTAGGDSAAPSAGAAAQ